ncbi:putative maltoporin [Vibrio paracholerae HE-16]|nr:maltoporin [Vibrio cholerae]EKG86095.1 putative maltoporin [Vibrio paracholerae HE-16]ORP14214.1 maltoporin [Vibrio paracholerae]EGR2515248.1 maltoporin [Vibrio cholerae]EGR4107634.1 maltoporin [Vibrio cholerae]
MELTMKKVSVIAAAVAATLAAGSFAAGTDLKNDGWQVNGYMSSNYRLVDGNTVAGNFGKADYRTVGTGTSDSTNQVEFVIKKHSEYENGVWANYVVRSEFGNGNTYAYSSDGAQIVDDNDGFAIKEAFVELGALPYLGADSSIWAGHRFLNRASGILSGEFWKQSSGLGAGFETKLAGKKIGVAIVSADSKIDFANPETRRTRTSHDIYMHGIDVGFGSMDIDAKYIKQENLSTDPSDQAKDGFGASITLNTSYYGLDGWAQTGVAYGNGTASNRGVNFGNWNPDFKEDTSNIFVTSYGVWNLAEKVQLGTEFVYHDLDMNGEWGADTVTRIMFAARPSFKVNDNLRLELTGGIAQETVKDAQGNATWGRTDTDTMFYSAEAAAVFTVNADYFGRPQIKPYVTYVTSESGSGANLSVDGKSEAETIIGVHAEIWF